MTPANRLSIRHGARLQASSTPVCAGPASRRVIAVSGSASMVTLEPSSEMVWPTSSAR